MFFCLLWEISRYRLISQITAKNDIISIVYTQETIRNSGTCVTLRKRRMSLPSETDIKQIRLEPGGGALLQEAIRDVPLDGVAFSRPE